MNRGLHIARLAIALISVAGATAALAAPRAFAGEAAPVPVARAWDKAGQCCETRVQRPPRVPRRDRYW